MGRLVGIARRKKKRAAMETLESAKVREESGVANDFRGKPGKRQVTLVSASAWAAVCDELGQEIPWTTRRANFLIEGVNFPKRTGDVIEVGGVRLLVTMQVDPCSRMEEQVAGLKQAMTPDWRGGVACTVLKGGTVRLGDDVAVLAEDG
jgi:MOSC domain-containing protein YiiM